MHHPTQGDVSSGVYRLVLNHWEHCHVNQQLWIQEEYSELRDEEQEYQHGMMEVSAIQEKKFEAGV